MALQAAMQKFVEKIVSMMKSEGLFEWQGGPIIMAQVNYPSSYHGSGDFVKQLDF